MRLHLHLRDMSNAPQELSEEFRDEQYSCAFCDSISRKYASTSIASELEMLYLEHLRKYHGLSR